MVKNNVYIMAGLKKKADGMYGVEIEAEGGGLPPVQEYWKVEHDPSLKSGYEAVEYVLDRPRSLEECGNALNYIRDQYQKYGSKVLETDTSGVHIHLNVQDYTPKQLFNLIVSYLILEDLILTYCGEMRVGNHFCLGSSHAEGLIHSLTQAAINQEIYNLNTEKLRYASLNVHSLFKYGSIEFRGMRGTGDTDAIFTWMQIIDNIRQEALNYNTPLDIVVSYSHDGERAFVKRFLKDKADLFLKVKNFEELIQNGVRRIQSLAFIPNWNTWKDERKNPFPVRRIEPEEE